MIKNNVIKLRILFVLSLLILTPISTFILQYYGRQHTVNTKKFLGPVTALPIETELELYLNGENKTSNPTIITYTNQLINLTISYIDSISKEFISGATVDVNGTGVSETLLESHGNYSVVLNTTELWMGESFLTIYARKEGYEPQSIILTILIGEIETELELYLNGDDKTNDPFIEIEITEMLNITIKYKDNQTGFPITNATVQLLGAGLNFNLTEDIELEQYYLLLDTTDLGPGIDILTIFAGKENYQPQWIDFIIELTEIPSNLQLFLNNTDKTNVPYIELTIKDLLNITVKYTDNQTGFHIPNATVQLAGDGLSFNFTEDTELGQYSLVLNTSNLGIGVWLFAIIAYAPNYIYKSLILRIDVSRIRGIISREDGGSQIEVYAGEDVVLNVILIDPQNNSIKNAVVVSNWVYGQGELEDLDNDGIYNISLLGVQEGVYNITISAYAGEIYDFEPYIITLIVYTPPPLILYSNASIPDTDGSFSLIWTSFAGANDFVVYQYFDYITEINSSVTILAEEITDFHLTLSGYSTGTYYFIVVAHSDYGEVISNCFQIVVEIQQIIPGYDIALLIGIISIIVISLKRRNFRYGSNH